MKEAHDDQQTEDEVVFGAEGEQLQENAAHDDEQVDIDEEQEELEDEEEMQDDEEVDELFSNESPKASTGGQNQLRMTARLTQLSESVAAKVMKTLRADRAQYETRFIVSQKDHDAMDDLINDIVNLGTIDANFLKQLTEDEVDKMIRSQQSKRSRAKSKAISKESYETMLVGAIAENLLRITSNKHKSIGGASALGDLGFSAEDLENLSNDPEELKKAIRNVQSKKSIAKAKADYDPLGARWLQLCAQEQQLKAIRDHGSVAAIRIAKEQLETMANVQTLITDVDIDSISGEDAKKLLQDAMNMLATR